MSSTETANAVWRVSNKMLGERKATLLVRVTLHLHRCAGVYASVVYICEAGDSGDFIGVDYSFVNDHAFDHTCGSHLWICFEKTNNMGLIPPSHHSRLCCFDKHNQSPQNKRINIGFMLILILETGEHWSQSSKCLHLSLFSISFSLSQE